MFKYTICDQPDEDIFERQCKALESHISGLSETEFFHDVDNSKIRIYDKDGAKIKVKNDFYVGGVFVDSEIELTQFFEH